MRSATAELATAQTAASRTPYFHCDFISLNDEDVHYDYSGTISRILEIRHTEGAYGGGATITLDNSDLLVPDLNGYYVEIGYGDVTVNGNEYKDTPRLWVRSQEWKSSPQGLYSTVTLIDGLSLLSELIVLLGTVPMWYTLYARDTTVWMILDAILTEVGFTLNTWGLEPSVGTNTADAGTDATTLVDAGLISSADDFYNDWQLSNTTRGLSAKITNYVGSSKTITCESIAGQTSGDSYKIIKTDEIITSFLPYFEINGDNNDLTLAAYSYESSNSAAYRAIMMTKSYLRARSGLVFDVIFPRVSDAVDLALTTADFYEYNKRMNTATPNAIYVSYNQDAAGAWAGTEPAKDPDAIALNNALEIPKYYTAPTILTAAEASNRAAAILTRERAETLSIGFVIRHDCRIELYDNLTVTDTRGI